ncbi:hypothetical protein D3C77_708750 [compost metagenome]
MPGGIEIFKRPQRIFVRRMKGRVLLSLQHRPAIIASSDQLSDNGGKINAAVTRNREYALTNAGDEVCTAPSGLL